MTTNRIQPVIKWSGSKRLQAPTIVKLFPRFSTYYEPFLGGGSVLFQVNPKKSLCGDICKPLIELWMLVKTNPKSLIDSYKENWHKLQKEGYTFYYEVRDRFNFNQNPFDLLFLSRTCVNGLIRFNKKGEFNNSLHHTRKGINPEKMAKIMSMWSNRIRNVEFVQGDYRDITRTATNRDFIYLDPPYFNTRGRYYGRIDFEEFVQFLCELNERGIRFALSLDGLRANKRYIVDLPRELFKRHFLIDSGNSTFVKVMNGKVEEVKESLYLNYNEHEGLSDYLNSAGPNSFVSSEANLVSLKSSE